MKLRLNIIIGALAALTFICGSTLGAQAKEINVKDNFFKFQKVKYWRGKAENITLGAFGQKKWNYLAIESGMKTSNLRRAKVKVVGPISINWSQFKSSAVTASASQYLKKSGGTGSFSHSKAKSAKLKLMKFYINEGNLRGVLNGKAANARRYLKNEGRDGRVVSEIWVVVEAELGEAIQSAASLSLTGTAKGVQFTLEGRTSGSTTSNFTLSSGTTFAYLLHKVKKWNRGKSKILNLEDDQVGLR